MQGKLASREVLWTIHALSGRARRVIIDRGTGQFGRRGETSRPMVLLTARVHSHFKAERRGQKTVSCWRGMQAGERRIGSEVLEAWMGE